MKSNDFCTSAFFSAFFSRIVTHCQFFTPLPNLNLMVSPSRSLFSSPMRPTDPLCFRRVLTNREGVFSTAHVGLEAQLVLRGHQRQRTSSTRQVGSRALSGTKPKLVPGWLIQRPALVSDQFESLTHAIKETPLVILLNHNNTVFAKKTRYHEKETVYFSPTNGHAKPLTI